MYGSQRVVAPESLIYTRSLTPPGPYEGSSALGRDKFLSSTGRATEMKSERESRSTSSGKLRVAPPVSRVHAISHVYRQVKPPGIRSSTCPFTRIAPVSLKHLSYQSTARPLNANTKIRERGDKCCPCARLGRFRKLSASFILRDGKNCQTCFVTIYVPRGRTFGSLHDYNEN